eukprot:gb/GEZN01000916.1/.p1 GENE.gb/GEZN01000916.1/~~gb/GEZN01000916.1/.p1  ORF type:complete len:972 (+),score=134.77 gb/GEZN01000916.1/:223-3138(+)
MITFSPHPSSARGGRALDADVPSVSAKRQLGQNGPRQDNRRERRQRSESRPMKVDRDGGRPDCLGEINWDDPRELGHLVTCRRKKHKLILPSNADLLQHREDVSGFIKRLVQGSTHNPGVSKILLQAPPCFRLDQLFHSLQTSPVCRPARSFGGPLMQFTPFKNPSPLSSSCSSPTLSPMKNHPPPRSRLTSSKSRKSLFSPSLSHPLPTHHSPPTDIQSSFYVALSSVASSSSSSSKLSPPPGSVKGKRSPRNEGKSGNPLTLLLLENVQDHPLSLVDARISQVKPGGLVLASREILPARVSPEKGRSYFLLDERYGSPCDTPSPIKRSQTSPESDLSQREMGLSENESPVKLVGSISPGIQRKSTPWQSPRRDSPSVSNQSTPVKERLLASSQSSPSVIDSSVDDSDSGARSPYKHRSPSRNRRRQKSSSKLKRGRRRQKSPSKLKRVSGGRGGRGHVLKRVSTKENKISCETSPDRQAGSFESSPERDNSMQHHRRQSMGQSMGAAPLFSNTAQPPFEIYAQRPVKTTPPLQSNLTALLKPLPPPLRQDLPASCRQDHLAFGQFTTPVKPSGGEAPLPPTTESTLPERTPSAVCLSALQALHLTRPLQQTGHIQSNISLGTDIFPLDLSDEGDSETDREGLDSPSHRIVRVSSSPATLGRTPANPAQGLESRKFPSNQAAASDAASSQAATQEAQMNLLSSKRWDRIVTIKFRASRHQPESKESSPEARRRSMQTPRKQNRARESPQARLRSIETLPRKQYRARAQSKEEGGHGTCGTVKLEQHQHLFPEPDEDQNQSCEMRQRMRQQQLEQRLFLQRLELLARQQEEQAKAKMYLREQEREHKLEQQRLERFQRQHGQQLAQQQDGPVGLHRWASTPLFKTGTPVEAERQHHHFLDNSMEGFESFMACVNDPHSEMGINHNHQNSMSYDYVMHNQSMHNHPDANVDAHHGSAVHMEFDRMVRRWPTM